MTPPEFAGAGVGVRTEQLLADLGAAEVKRGGSIAVVLAPEVGVALVVEGRRWTVAPNDAAAVLAHVEEKLRPRWISWSNDTGQAFADLGVRAATVWDLSAIHRLLFGGWRGDPARVWAALHDLPESSIPSGGQLDLLDLAGGSGPGEDPDQLHRPDGHLNPDWPDGGWSADAERMTRWAEAAWTAAGRQHRRLRSLRDLGGVGNTVVTAHSESTAELLCAELAADGLPLDRAVAEQLIASYLGPRPAGPAEEGAARTRRDEVVFAAAGGHGEGVDLRNPAEVRVLLARVGIEVPDTRSWRLKPFREAHPLVPALLRWRKAERISTTYGFHWLDERVDADGRLRGAWTGTDGAAGRMTAQNGLHNLPSELRPAVRAEPGHRFVRADLGQIEPRVLAAVSGDPALIAATADPDLYAPVAARLRVERPVAKVAVLAAMYGQTSGAAGEALRGMESAYPVAMDYLRRAEEAGRTRQDVRTYGGRLVRMPGLARELDEAGERSAIAGRGRYARNAVVQGAAAELFKAWAVTVRARLRTAVPTEADARIVLCLHDELLVHVRADWADAAATIVADSLQVACRLWIDSAARFVVDVSVIGSWSEAKETPPVPKGPERPGRPDRAAAG